MQLQTLGGRSNPFKKLHLSPLSLARVVCIGVPYQRNYEIEQSYWSIGKGWIQGVLHMDQSLEYIY